MRNHPEISHIQQRSKSRPAGPAASICSPAPVGFPSADVAATPGRSAAVAARSPAVSAGSPNPEAQVIVT